MEPIKIDQAHLTAVQEVLRQRVDTEIALGRAVHQLRALQDRITDLHSALDDIAAKELALMTTIQQQYGPGQLNAATGEYKVTI